MGLDKCVEFERELCFELGKCMWRKHHSVFQYHLKYICDDIVKLFRVGILCYAECVQEMHDLEKRLTPPLMKGDSFEADSWKFHDKSLSVGEIRVAIKDGLPLSILYDLEYNQ